MGLAIPIGPGRSWWSGGPWLFPAQGVTLPPQVVPPATINTFSGKVFASGMSNYTPPSFRIGVPPDGPSPALPGPDRLGPDLAHRLSIALWTIFSIRAWSPRVAPAPSAPSSTGPTCRIASACRPAPPNGAFAASQQAAVSAAFWRFSGRHTVSIAPTSVPPIARRKWSRASSSRYSGGMLACAIPTEWRISCANSPNDSWERRLRPLS